MSVESQIRGIIAEQLGIEEHTVKNESTFDDMGADEIDKIEIIMSIEEDFDIEIPEADFDKMLTVQDATVQDVIDYVEENT